MSDKFVIKTKTFYEQQNLISCYKEQCMHYQPVTSTLTSTVPAGCSTSSPHTVRNSFMSTAPFPL